MTPGRLLSYFLLASAVGHASPCSTVLMALSALTRALCVAPGPQAGSAATPHRLLAWYPNLWAVKVAVPATCFLTKDSEWTVKSAEEFLSRIKRLEVEADEVMVSFDVISLFTSIPPALAIDTIDGFLREKYDETDQQLKRVHIIQLLELCLKTFFTFNGQVYEQKKGTPMGSPLSGLIAEAVLQRLRAARYVDDTFVIIKRSDVQTFKTLLNSIFPDIQFTMEEELNNTLAFFDVQVTKLEDGKIRTTVYRKATNTRRILHFKSNHPVGHKRSCVRTLFQRVQTHCSDDNGRKEEIKYLHALFKANGYPKSFIRKCLKKPHPERSDGEKPKFWLAIPYVKNVSEATARILKPFGIGVAHKPESTIRQQIMRPKDPLPVTEQSAVVYSIPCQNCDARFPRLIDKHGKNGVSLSASGSGQRVYRAFKVGGGWMLVTTPTTKTQPTQRENRLYVEDTPQQCANRTKMPPLPSHIGLGGNVRTTSSVTGEPVPGAGRSKGQRKKVQRHNKSPSGTFPSPDARFNHVHLDVVGPLSPSNGYTHLLTCVDRYTRWPEAIPLPNVQAETIVKAFVSRWVAIFGAPSMITTDRGAQFESTLFQTLLNFLGCTRIRTTAYHPAANGMAERFHCQLKTALRAAEDSENWSDNVPVVLLGIRAALKSDLDCSAAELVFGTTLRLPGEMVTPTSRGAEETPENFVHRLRQFMRSLSPVPPRAPSTEPYVEKGLANCTHVFVRCDRVRKPLESPYEGPFRVLARNSKTFRILRGDKEDVVSIDRVKAAVAEEPPDVSQGQACADPIPPPTPLPLSPPIPPSRILPLPSCSQHQTATSSSTLNLSTTTPTQLSPTVPPAYITRSGRHVHFPDRLVTHFS
ncbi:hypothetical protein SprV_0100337000 [Sparganum proliferum]